MLIKVILILKHIQDFVRVVNAIILRCESFGLKIRILRVDEMSFLFFIKLPIYFRRIQFEYSIVELMFLVDALNKLIHLFAVEISAV